MTDNERSKKWYFENKEKRKLYIEKNRELIYSKKKEWIKLNYQNYRNTANNYEFLKRKTDLNFRLAKNLRTRLSISIKNKKASAIKDLGCSIDELKQHLESKFQPGMTWDNYGDWHIDHIKPLVAFDLSKTEEIQKVCHYTNLQPLWAKENISKGKKTLDL